MGTEYLTASAPTVTVDGVDVGYIKKGSLTKTYKEDEKGLEIEGLVGDAASLRSKVAVGLKFTIMSRNATVIKALKGFTTANTGSDPVIMTMDLNSGKKTPSVIEITDDTFYGLYSGTITCGDEKMSDSEFWEMPVEIKILQDPDTKQFGVEYFYPESSTALAVSSFETVTDATPPVATTITTSTTTMAIDQGIQATFNLDIAPTMLNSNYFSVVNVTDEGAAPVAGTFDYGSTMKKLVFTPTASLTNSKTYMIMVKKGIRAVNGATLSADAVIFPATVGA